MSGSVELDLWLHEYEEAALSDALKQRGMTVREYLQQQVNRAYEEMVPSDVRAQVAHRIGEERAAQLAEREASRRFAIFHIKEHGEEFRFLTNHNIEFLDAGRLLRNYVRSMQDRPDQGKSFAYWFRERVPLTPAEFDAYVDERISNSGRVTGAFDIDLDISRSANKVWRTTTAGGSSWTGWTARSSGVKWSRPSRRSRRCCAAAGGSTPSRFRLMERSVSTVTS